MIIDLYSIDIVWETYIQKYVKKIFVIDDYYDKKHNCDFLLNQLCYKPELYDNLINKNCNLLYGKEYFILDKKYLKNFTLNNNNRLTRINIFMGGIDKTNDTEKIIKKCN